MAILSTSVMPVTVPVILLGVVISSIFIKFFLQYWSLRHIPGPWQAKLTNFWLARKFWNHENFVDIANDLDRKYGPVVAYGPNRVLFSDASALPAIFNTKDVLPKSDAYASAVPVVNGTPTVTLATEQSEPRVSAIKKQIIGAFTTKAMLDYEHHVDRNVELFLSGLRKAAVKGGEIDIVPWLTFFAFDTVCRIAFSDDQGLMSAQADMENSLDAGRQRFNHWHMWQSLPWLEHLIYKNPWALRQSARAGKAGKQGSKLGQLAATRFQERLEKGGLGTHADLLDRFLQGAKRDPTTITNSTVVGLVMSMINAGADTTSATLNVTLYHLLANPKCLAALKREIDAAQLSTIPQWTQVQHLHYLEACIKEAGRLNPLLLDPMERVVPATGPGIEVAGVYIPPGNIVAMNTHVLNRDPSVFGERPNEYRPERWIECDEQTLAKMERANIFFSVGRRLCIGQHIAWIEMKKILPALLMNFDIEPATPNAPMHKQNGTMNLFVETLMVRLTPR